MIKPKVAMAAICTLSTAAAAQEDEPVPPPPPFTAQSRDFHVVASGLVGLDQPKRHRYGFALDGLIETTVPHWFDVGFGAGFGRLAAMGGPLTFALAEGVLSRQTPVASFFGLGFGVGFLDGRADPAAKIGAGIEAFHDGPVPIQLGVDVLAKFCAETTVHVCGKHDTATYVVARLGVRM